MPEETDQKDTQTSGPSATTPSTKVTADQAMLQALAEVEKEPRPTIVEQPAPSFAINTPLAEPTKKPRGKKKLIIILAIVVLLIFGSGGTAFALWFNNPDTVTDDAVKNLISAKTMVNDGSYTFKQSDSKLDINIAFKSQSDMPKLAGALDVTANINDDKTSLKISGAGMVSESGTVYFKFTNLSQFLNGAFKTDYGKAYASSPKLQAAIKKFVAKIDNRWISVDKSDIAAYSAGFDSERSCYKKALGAFYDQPSQQNQIVDAYKAHRFMVIKATGGSEAINGQDGVAYNVTSDIRQSDEFAQALEKTDVGKALAKCQKTSKTNPDEFDRKESARDKQKRLDVQQKEADKTKTTVWISRWSHQLLKIQTSTNDKSESTHFEASFSPNQPLQLKDPQKSIKAKDLQKELDVLYKEAAGV